MNNWMIMYFRHSSPSLILCSTLRFQLLRQSHLLPSVSSPSTYPVTAKTNLRPALTAFINMFQGKELLKKYN